MGDEPRFFTCIDFEGVPEITLGSADFVSRPVIVLAQDEILEFIDQAKPKKLVINFANVSHISSEFINTMLRINEHVAVNDGVLKLSHMNSTVQTPFKLTNLAGRVFKIYDTTPEAIDAF